MPSGAHTRPRPYRADALRTLGLAYDTSRFLSRSMACQKSAYPGRESAHCTNANSARHASAGVGSDGTQQLLGRC